MRHYSYGAGQLSEPQVTLERIRTFAVFGVVFFALIISRLWYLQIYRGEAFREQADSNRLKPVREIAPRGEIRDASGKVVLVRNGAQFTVFIVPTDLPKPPADRQAELNQLASILSLTPVALQAVIKKNDPGALNPIPVAEGVDQHVVAQIAENRLRLPGIITNVEPVRQYPFGSLAAHVIGYIGQVTTKQLDDQDDSSPAYERGDFAGQAGIEKQYDNLLNGTAGGLLYEVDARGRRRKQVGEDPVIAGDTVTLGINYAVQKACEDALGQRKGAAVAVDPRDGHVIAMASYPAYDPTIFARRPLSSALYLSLRDRGAFLNRAVESAQPPGSTFKIVTSAAGLASGKITEYTTQYCPGGITLGKTWKKCHGTHGSVNLIAALEESCDVFFYECGFRITPETIADWAEKFGLGQRTGIDLEGELKGIVPSPKWKQALAKAYARRGRSFDAHWGRGDTANIAIGQGAVTATPIQMAMAVAAIGNGGSVYRPQLILKATSSADGHTAYEMKPEITHKLPLTPEQLAEISRGMRAVIIGSRGTSHAANLAGVEVAGKSGSAELKGGGMTHAWFVCYAPMKNPTIAISVFLDADGHKLGGGKDAAPVARKMMAAYFGLPDRIAPASGGMLAD